MLAALTCERTYLLDDLCRTVAPHDPTGLGGPLLERLVGPIIVFLVVYVVGRVLRRLAERAVDRASGDQQVGALVHNVGSALIYVFAILSGLVSAGLPLSLLLTFGGLTSLAIGLAFQDVLRNVLAGIWLLLEHPFRIGDQISVADSSGVVQTITLRTTTLRTGDGRLTVVPNLTVFTGVVVNSSAFAVRRFAVTVRVERDRDLEAVMSTVRRELEAVTQVERRPAPTIIPTLDSEAILLECRFWVDHTRHNGDAVTAAVAGRLWSALGERVPPLPKPS